MRPRGVGGAAHDYGGGGGGGSCVCNRSRMMAVESRVVAVLLDLGRHDNFVVSSGLRTGRNRAGQDRTGQGLCVLAEADGWNVSN